MPDDFAFQHALIREVAYQQLTRDQRIAASARRRDARTGVWRGSVTGFRGARAPLVPGRGAGRHDQVLGSGRVAGSGRRRVRGGRRLLGTCIRLARSRGRRRGSDRIRWHRQVADARHGMGQLEARSAAAHQALRMAGGRPAARRSAARAGCAFGRLKPGLHQRAARGRRHVAAWIWHAHTGTAPRSAISTTTCSERSATA